MPDQDDGDPVPVPLARKNAKIAPSRGAAPGPPPPPPPLSGAWPTMPRLAAGIGGSLHEPCMFPPGRPIRSMRAFSQWWCLATTNVCQGCDVSTPSFEPRQRLATSPDPSCFQTHRPHPATSTAYWRFRRPSPGGCQAPPVRDGAVGEHHSCSGHPSPTQSILTNRAHEGLGLGNGDS